jgi:phospholipase A1/A2
MRRMTARRPLRYLLWLLAASTPALAAPQLDGDDTGHGAQPIPAEPPVAAGPPAGDGNTRSTHEHSRIRLNRSDEDAYAIVSVARGLSTHKPMYLLPFTYGRGIEGQDTETVFQISAKQRLFNSNLFFGYTQKSHWQIFDEDESRPFRETNYNPELFYRWTPDPERFHHWGADVGIEHESNGEEALRSRSWNRLYIAPFQAKGRTLRYLKFWYRIPEDRKDTPLDPKGDDNPDIYRFMGYAEAHVQRQLGGGSMGHLMLRGNPSTGKGAVQFNYTWPSRDGSLFYMATFFHGYGETLIDYDRVVTRIGVGFAVTR